MTVTASRYPLKKNDLYETEEWAVYVVIGALKSLGLWRDGAIWEPAAGNHAMVTPFYLSGATSVVTSDIATYGPAHSFMFDFIKDGDPPVAVNDCDIITNPPYGPGNRLAVKFVHKALARCDGYVAMLLTAKFDFGSTRTDLFKDCHRFVAKLALLDRVSWEGNGETGTEDHAWYIWGPQDMEPVAPTLLYERNPTKE